MKLEIRITKKWIAALRSGQYKQTNGMLRRINLDSEMAYCCLGVACDISEVGFWRDGKDFSEYVTDNYFTTMNMSPDLLKKFGLSRDRHDTLTRMNDGGKSFDEIADQLEAWLRKDK